MTHLKNELYIIYKKIKYSIKVRIKSVRRETIITIDLFNFFRLYETAMSYSSVKNYRLRPTSAGLTALIPEYLYSDRLNKRLHQSPHSPLLRARLMAVIKAY